MCGDIVHVPAQQFAQPTLTWAYDEDPVTARTTRLRILEDAAATGMWLAGAHLGRPGLGRVIGEGEAYRFEAASLNNYKYERYDFLKYRSKIVRRYGKPHQ